ncbi:MAG: DNA polymerase III subunit delta' [bacterium]|jgi:DNA polymerase-3 subunit delta'|nr:DNA polymerase III subunit delta' [bacterium]MDD3805600.1 DNA polymerase III subunit delta' [bacterium]MDD4153607.1 DNA polymerase III subunit delta' [bacterium]MDD4558908.1 DNA polymerase III subunit delta' [bacterium]
MIFFDIIGHAAARKSLCDAVKRNRISNAYIFCGRPGIGRTSLAMAYAAYLNCNGRTSDDACGVCSSCLKIASGGHPDVTVLKPERAVIRIDDVREMIRDCIYPPFEGNWKVYIIDDADRLGEGAANAMLKTLEEAPARAVFILIAGSAANLLPTIASRCQIVELFAPSRDELLDGLRRNVASTDVSRADAAYRLSGGLPSKAFKILKGEDISLEKDLWEELMEHILSRDPLRALRAAECMQVMAAEYGDRIEGIIGVLDEVCRRIVRNTIENAEGPSAAIAISLAEEAKAALRLNANPQLTLESFIIQLQLRG